MNEALNFILRIQDLMTPGMRQAAAVTDNAASRIQNQFDRITGKSRTMNASLNEMKQRLEAVNNVRFGTRLQSEFNAATREAQRLEAQINRMSGRGGGRGMGGGMMGSIIGGNLIAGGIAAAGGLVVGGATDAYRTGMETIGMRSALNATTRGQGAQAFDMTANLSNRYGLNLQANLEGVKTLTGGLMGLNMPLAKQMEIFEGVAVGAAVLKLNTEQLKGSMLALGQMSSKGTVSAEELRGQLGERIPGAFGIAARAMGVTEQRLNQMLQRGEIAASDFLPKFAAEMQKTFGAQALANANGPHAVAERFNNAMFAAKSTIGEGLMPVVTPMLELFTRLATAVIPYISEGLRQVTTWVSGINISGEHWQGWIAIVKDYGMMTWEVIKGIGLNVWNIVSGIFKWLGNSVLVQDIVWAIQKGFQALFFVIQKAGDLLQWIWESILLPILNAIEKVYTFTKGLLGFGGKATVEQKITMAATPPAAPTGPGVNPVNIVQPAGAAPGGAGNLEAGRPRSEAISNGGQRSITISIGKQIEKLEVHVMNAQEGAAEIENAVREAMRRVLYNLNGVAAG